MVKSQHLGQNSGHPGQWKMKNAPPRSTTHLHRRWIHLMTSRGVVSWRNNRLITDVCQTHRTNTSEDKSCTIPPVSTHQKNKRAQHRQITIIRSVILSFLMYSILAWGHVFKSSRELIQKTRKPELEYNHERPTVPQQRTGFRKPELHPNDGQNQRKSKGVVCAVGDPPELTAKTVTTIRR